MIFHCLLTMLLCRMIHQGPAQDRPVAYLAAFEASVTAWDYTETRINIRDGGFEYNRVMRPFVHNTATLVAEGAAETIGSAFLADKMRHSRYAAVRKIWWLPQGAAIFGHINGATYSTTHRPLPRPLPAIPAPVPNRPGKF